MSQIVLLFCPNPPVASRVHHRKPTWLSMSWPRPTVWFHLLPLPFSPLSPCCSPPWPLVAPMTPKPAPARVAPSLQVSSQVILKVTPQALCLLSPPFPCSASACSTYVPAMWYLLFWMASYSSMNSMRVDTLPFHLFLCPGSEHDAKVGTQCVFVEWILDDGILSESSTLQVRIVVCVCVCVCFQKSHLAKGNVTSFPSHFCWAIERCILKNYI